MFILVGSFTYKFQLAVHHLIEIVLWVVLFTGVMLFTVNHTLLQYMYKLAVAYMCAFVGTFFMYYNTCCVLKVSDALVKTTNKFTYIYRCLSANLAECSSVFMICSFLYWISIDLVTLETLRIP